MEIEGGYFIVARKMFESVVMQWPPEWFKLWVWLIGKANHDDVKQGGVIYRKGEVMTSYTEMIMAASYKVGWRVIKTSKSNIRNFCEALRKHQMATTRKSTRGFLICLDRYAFYQDPSRYERHNEEHNKSTTKAQTSSTINKNDKNEKIKEEEQPDEIVVTAIKKTNRISLTRSQAAVLLREFPGIEVEELKEQILKCNDYMTVSSTEYSNPGLFFRAWLKRYTIEKVKKMAEEKRKQEAIPQLQVISKEQMQKNIEKLAEIKGKFTIKGVSAK